MLLDKSRPRARSDFSVLPSGFGWSCLCLPRQLARNPQDAQREDASDIGVAVEEHLSNAIRPLIKKELSARGRSLKPVGSLPPIKPRNMHVAGYGEIESEERQERWLSKTKRMAQEDFVTAAGKLPLNYPGSVHVTNVGDATQTKVGYNPPPASLERGVDKTRWVSEQNFKAAVPSNRFVDPARDQLAMSMTMGAPVS